MRAHIGTRAAVSRRLWSALLMSSILLGWGAQATRARADTCERIVVTPARPTVGELVTVRFRVLESSVPSGQSRAVDPRVSVTGPGRRTLPLEREQSPVDARSFRSRFRPAQPGSWHVRVLIFAADAKEGGPPGNPLCYGSERFLVQRPVLAPPPAKPGGFPAELLPILGLVPIVLAISLLTVSGRGHRG